jgi:hypothetical protein
VQQEQLVGTFSATIIMPNYLLARAVAPLGFGTHALGTEGGLDVAPVCGSVIRPGASRGNRTEQKGR